ncbi:hypothetical protein C8R47DRAFT_173868 [Mycena vitilis]|nr:hypothetical protein C8R47DRAFT_173868 [Mycena vitilis]
MDSHSDSAASINPYPTDWSRWCSKCRTPSLKPPRLCKGNGKDIYNFGRHYQPCENTDCDEWLWNNPPTPLDRIPYDVQLRFTVRKSAAEDSESGILCVAEGCRTRAKNEPRKANVACGRPFPHCSGCCKRFGGCNLSTHRPDVQPNGTSGESSMSSQPAASSSVASPDIRRLWARPLSETYLGFRGHCMRMADPSLFLFFFGRGGEVSLQLTHELFNT